MWARVVGSTFVDTLFSCQFATGLYTATRRKQGWSTVKAEDRLLGRGSREDHRWGGHDMLKTFPPNLFFVVVCKSCSRAGLGMYITCALASYI